MSTQTGLEWIAGDGWLVLTGEHDETSELRAQALHRIGLDRGFAYLGLDEAAGDAEIADFEDLGAPTGYLVNILTEDDDTIRANLRDVGLIVIDTQADPRRMLDALRGAAADAVREAYERGALVLAEGPVAQVFGACWLSETGSLHEGLNWISETLILPGVGEQADVREIVAPVFARRPRTLALGISNGSALALGPGATLEVWGDNPVALTLGPGFLRPTNRASS
jgi:hypothetical protein